MTSELTLADQVQAVALNYIQEKHPNSRIGEDFELVIGLTGAILAWYNEQVLPKVLGSALQRYHEEILQKTLQQLPIPTSQAVAEVIVKGWLADGAHSSKPG